MDLRNVPDMPPDLLVQLEEAGIVCVEDLAGCDPDDLSDCIACVPVETVRLFKVRAQALVDEASGGGEAGEASGNAETDLSKVSKVSKVSKETKKESSGRACGTTGKQRSARDVPGYWENAERDALRDFEKDMEDDSKHPIREIRDAFRGKKRD